MKSIFISIGIGTTLILSGLVWTISIYPAIAPQSRHEGAYVEINFSLQNERQEVSFTPPEAQQYVLYLTLTNSTVKPGVPEMGPEPPRTYGGAFMVTVTSTAADTLFSRKFPEPEFPYLEPASFEIYALDTMMVGQPGGNITLTTNIMQADPAFSNVTGEITLEPPFNDRNPRSLFASYGELALALFLTLLGLSTVIVSAIVYRLSMKSNPPVL